MATRIGVSDLYAAELLQDGPGGVEFDTPFRIAKAIEITINPQVQEASLYADDELSEYYSATTGYDISLHVDDLIPEVRGKLLGQEPDENGFVNLGSDNIIPTYAIMFRSKRSDGSYEYRVQYKNRFNPTEDAYETQGESVNFQTPTITGRSMALDHNGSYGGFMISNDENQAVINKWFEEPYGSYDKITTTGTTE